ncbi:hypothetical protein KAFR_0D04490 [Kazachstania africana CBS 2517]|uniref:dTMP kinase n=1 Tax=Kazachstania africana (strain ATCC 22294 / BCRC 22015 / CBS 2517 / CECT 1963 / NBRC 1671 / NRRL Y-8276) TaxID=1071382 RepID=H2AUP7_KAZAF|nr:hypothetical protein KAFR_0D04490 [Kazachstania africana CBS 2517]CCF58097.1 hypothetical protein KAFR_0D04490 [Kazachstania africana CBS 2517]
MTRGKFILIEGLDRAGKTTQVNRLYERLSPNSESMKFPERSTQIGGLINEYLTNKSFQMPDQTIHLLFSSNRWERQEYIEKTLVTDKKHIVMDRYVYSGIAYSLAKEVDGMDFDWCFGCDKGLIRPDMTVFLVNSKSNDNREGFGKERYEQKCFQEKVHEKFDITFQKLATKDNTSPVQIIDVTDKSITEVEELIWKVVEPVVGAKSASNQLLRF